MSARRDVDVRRAAGAADLARSGERDAPVEIVDGDPAWPRRFAAEADRLARIAGLRVEHIGSTAVPGLAAKPIIDMMALVDDLDAPLPALVDRAGYRFPAAYNATLEGRRWLCRPSAARRTHHLHLVSDPAELARHLAFRDALRGDSRLARSYADLKRRFAREMAGDREGYAAAKTAFVRRAEAAFREGRRYSPAPPM